jgi:hypothetical protein
MYKNMPHKQEWWVKQTLLKGGKMQLVFAIMLLVVLVLLVPFLQEYNRIVQYRKASNPQYQWPRYEDLYIAAASFSLLYFCKMIIVPNAKKFMMKFIKPKFTGIERELRAEKAAYNIYKMLYFTSGYIIGTYVCIGADWFPRSLGGSGDSYRIFKGFPYQSTESYPYLRGFIMFQLGFHTQVFVSHLINSPKKNFIEMFLHHFMTVLLIVLAYYMNYIPVSGIVLVLHDFSDIFVTSTRILLDTPYSKSMLTNYFMLMISWVFTRLVLYPMLVVYPCIYLDLFDEGVDKYGWSIFAGLLHFLLCMHIYWFVLLFKMGFGYIMKNTAAVDLQDEIEPRHAKSQ